MTKKDIDTIIKIICPNDADFEKSIISPMYLKQELEQLALEQEPSYNSIKTELSGDAISRQAAIELFAKNADEVRPYSKTWEEVKALPSVTPQPKMGYWEWNQYDANPKIGNFHCSLCHSIGRTYFDYCPYCGAKMAEIPTGAEMEEQE